MKRVMIVGGPGSGKSTLARGLGAITGLPVFHIDHIDYQPGWTERSQPDQTALAQSIHGQDRWNFESGFSTTYATRAARADTVIWLDLPLSVRFARILKRRVQFNRQTRPDLPDDCPERLDLGFLAFMYRTRHSGREKIAQMIADTPHLTVHHIRTTKGADTFLEWLQD
ncbi:MAG: AAA family ATPase [Paracoccaceae bacterium]